MRRTTIRNSSFKQSFYPQSKGSTPKGLTLNPSTFYISFLKYGIFLIAQVKRTPSA